MWNFRLFLCFPTPYHDVSCCRVAVKRWNCQIAVKTAVAARRAVWKCHKHSQRLPLSACRCSFWAGCGCETVTFLRNPTPRDHKENTQRTWMKWLNGRGIKTRAVWKEPLKRVFGEGFSGSDRGDWTDFIWTVPADQVTAVIRGSVCQAMRQISAHELRRAWSWTRQKYKHLFKRLPCPYANPPKNRIYNKNK